MKANEGNYSDEIEFDPETAKVPMLVPGAVLEHWIMKCHQKNGQLNQQAAVIEELEIWQEWARRSIRALLPHAMVNGVCQVCHAHLPEESHHHGCLLSIGHCLLDRYFILLNLPKLEADQKECNQ